MIYIHNYMGNLFNPADKVFTPVEISLQVDAPFSSAHVSIFNSTEVSYTAVHRNGEEINEEFQISREQFEELVALTDKNVPYPKEESVNPDYFEANEKYYDEGLMDGTSYNLTIVSFSNDNRKMGFPTRYSVRCYGTCPAGVSEVIQAIKRIFKEAYGQDIVEVGV